MDERDGEAGISNEQILQMTTNIVSSFVSNNTIPADTVPEVIRQVHKTVHLLASTPTEKQLEKPKPAVSIKNSVTDDYIVCLEDGKKLKMLKRYLRSNYNMTPDEYRRKWGLPSRLPDGRPELRGQALGVREKDRSGQRRAPQRLLRSSRRVTQSGRADRARSFSCPPPDATCACAADGRAWPSPSARRRFGVACAGATITTSNPVAPSYGGDTDGVAPRRRLDDDLASCEDRGGMVARRRHIAVARLHRHSYSRKRMWSSQ